MAEKFVKSIEDVTKEYVKDFEEKVYEFIDRICETYHLNELELQSLWKTPIAAAAVSVDAGETKYCNHKFTKGKRIGMMCLQKISGSMVTKCSKHHKKTKEKPMPSVTDVDVNEIPAMFDKSVSLLESDTEEFDSE